MRSCQDLNHFKPFIHTPNLLQSAYFTCIQMHPGIPKNYENIWKSWRDLQMSFWISQSHASWRKKMMMCNSIEQATWGYFCLIQKSDPRRWRAVLDGINDCTKESHDLNRSQIAFQIHDPFISICLQITLCIRFVYFVPGTLGRHKSLHSCCGLSSLASKTETENVP